MAADFPYLPSYKNVGKLFEKIASAKIPEAFTQKYLYETIGLKGQGDRPLIPLLKTLGFLDASNKPTPEFAKLKNPQLAKIALGVAIKKAYAPLFEANENANSLSLQDLKGLIAQVAGTDNDMTSRISGTFNSLVKLASFSEIPAEDEESQKGQKEESDEKKEFTNSERGGQRKHMNAEFHYNLQIQCL